MVILDREDYLREANSQLSDKDVYQEMRGFAKDHLMKIIKNVLKKARNKHDFSD